MRRNPAVLGFYEPLNEALGSMRRDEIDAFRADSWASEHPAYAGSYFAEFAPLLRRFRRGVIGYRDDFALDHTFGEGMRDARFERYLTSLVRLAEDREKVGVFKFTRTLGRLAQMRAMFPQATHLVVLRNPWDQWCSAWHQAAEHANPYFLIAPALALHRSRQSAIVRDIMRELGVGSFDFGRGRFQQQFDRALHSVITSEPEVSYRAFLAHWLLTAADGVHHGQIVVDVESMHACEMYRLAIQKAIEDCSGLAVDLRDDRPASDCKSETVLRPPFAIERIHEIAEDALHALYGNDREGGRVCSAVCTKLDEAVERTRQRGVRPLPVPRR